MSADNGIYILETLKNEEQNPYKDVSTGIEYSREYEYRVREMAAIENLNFDENAPAAVPPPGDYHSVYELRPEDKAHCAYQEAYNNRYHSHDPDVLINNARNMWKGCKVFTDKSSALLYASEMEDDFVKNCGYSTEYGISIIKIARVF